jgi:hypothetical protein
MQFYRLSHMKNATQRTPNARSSPTSLGHSCHITLKITPLADRRPHIYASYDVTPGTPHVLGKDIFYQTAHHARKTCTRDLNVVTPLKGSSCFPCSSVHPPEIRPSKRICFCAMRQTFPPLAPGRKLAKDLRPHSSLFTKTCMCAWHNTGSQVLRQTRCLPATVSVATTPTDVQHVLAIGVVPAFIANGGAAFSNGKL